MITIEELVIWPVLVFFFPPLEGEKSPCFLHEWDFTLTLTRCCGTQKGHLLWRWHRSGGNSQLFQQINVNITGHFFDPDLCSISLCSQAIYSILIEQTQPFSACASFGLFLLQLTVNILIKRNGYCIIPSPWPTRGLVLELTGAMESQQEGVILARESGS